MFLIRTFHHDRSVHVIVMGPIYKQFSDRHCVLHQLCVVPSQIRCSLTLELHFVGDSSSRESGNLTGAGGSRL